MFPKSIFSLKNHLLKSEEANLSESKDLTAILRIEIFKATEIMMKKKIKIT
jgi:hypothetical protein